MLSIPTLFVPSINSGQALSPSKDSENTFKPAAIKTLLARSVLPRLLFALIILVTPLNLIAQERILVGYDGHLGFQGAIWATKDLGRFEKHGLAGDLIPIPDSARGMAALLSGNVPFIQASATAPLAAFLRGGDKAIKIYANRLKQKDLTILEEPHSFYGANFSLPPRIDRSGIANTLDLVRQTSEVKGEVKLASFVDETIIDELEREGYYKKFADPKAKK